MLQVAACMQHRRTARAHACCCPQQALLLRPSLRARSPALARRRASPAARSCRRCRAWRARPGSPARGQTRSAACSPWPATCIGSRVGAWWAAGSVRAHTSGGGCTPMHARREHACERAPAAAPCCHVSRTQPGQQLILTSSTSTRRSPQTPRCWTARAAAAAGHAVSNASAAARMSAARTQAGAQLRAPSASPHRRAHTHLEVKDLHALLINRRLLQLVPGVQKVPGLAGSHVVPGTMQRGADGWWRRRWRRRSRMWAGGEVRQAPLPPVSVGVRT